VNEVEILTALCLFWIFYAYVGYGLLLAALACFAPRVVRKDDVFPSLSFIIAVHNGGAALARKLEATLALAYPGPLEILVSSDGSNDDSEAVARRFESRGVVVLAHPEQRGKEAAQAAAIRVARGEILVFSDVASALEADTLRQLVCPFADTSIGAVSSEDAVDSDGGEGVYVRYEMALRRLESRATTLVGLSGSLFAVRRALCEPWPTHLASDFRTALEAARRGFRTVAEPAARAHFGTLHSAGMEWARKVRTFRRGIAVLLTYRGLLHPRYGRAAFSLWGHKLARFTSPFALLGLLVASGAGAWESNALLFLFTTQMACYVLAVLALLLPRLSALRPARLAGFFLLVNAAVLVAWAYHVSGRRAVVWQPTRR